MKTLDFEEWLVFRERNVLLEELKLIRENEDYISLVYNELQEVFNEYLVFGGYPAVVLENDSDEKINLLKDIN